MKTQKTTRAEHYKDAHCHGFWVISKNTPEVWKEAIQQFEMEFALDGQTALGLVVKWYRLNPDQFTSLLDFNVRFRKREGRLEWMILE